MQITVFLGLLAAFFSPVQDDVVIEEATKVEFARTIGDDPALDILGVACRKRYFVKVYAIGLYAEKGPVMEALSGNTVGDEAQAKAVIESTGHRALVLKFVRNVGAKSIRGAFEGGIEKTMKIDDPSIAEDAKALLDSFADVKKGDVAELHFNGAGTIILSGNGEEILKVENLVLEKVLLAIYIGENPIDKKIKANLLELF